MRAVHEKALEGKECGECTACCTATNIPELDKMMWEDCRHLKGGCTIYETRPEVCRRYECLWRAGLFGQEEHRPDKLGILFETQFSGLLQRTVILAREVKKDAVKNQKVQYYIEQFAKKELVHLFPYREPIRMELLGPEKLVQLTKGLR